jgi:hypothetical protein
MEYRTQEALSPCARSPRDGANGMNRTDATSSTATLAVDAIVPVLAGFRPLDQVATAAPQVRHRSVN